MRTGAATFLSSRLIFWVFNFEPGRRSALQPLLQDAVASDAEEDRCLCHSVGAPQVQADAPSDQGGTRLVLPATSGEPPALRPLATMSWQRPNIGSRVNREVHARFWERLGVKLLRATRQFENVSLGHGVSLEKWRR